jgi:RNA polymerase sigma-70 factor (ECF subfamily)
VGGGDAAVGDDDALYRQVKMGDQDALRVLVARYHRPLFEFLYRLMDDRALADDLAQQTFIRLLTFTGDAPTHLRGWLFTIARNLAYDHFRSAQVRHESSIDADLTLSDDDFTPEQMTLLADQRQMIAQMLHSLPPEQREVVILRFYHDLSLQAIAEVVNAPLGTVKSRLFHALKKLRVYLIAMEQTDE